ncbi:MAG: AAA family ATPase [Anaerolineae bacterium]|nr:AAA family ATPase [Anaerolineae bacterium]
MEGIISFGYWVRRQRKALDLTQAVLARRVGCSLVTIQKIEQDERRPSRQIAELLANQLFIPEADRDHFLGMARGEFVAAPNSPLNALPVPLFLRARDQPQVREEARFVARQQELAQLNTFLELALAGQGRVIFVLGEAGRGKTALVQEFTRRAQEAQLDLVVATGNCNAYSGIGDPYLPFREILGLLTGEIEARWRAGALNTAQAERLWQLLPAAVQIITSTGPDLLDTFIPLPALVSRAKAAAPGGTGWLTRLEAVVATKAAGQEPGSVKQNDLFEQYVKVLLALAQQRPVLLVLDDLQWADTGSISLLFHLGRRLAGSRLLVVGIYRPAEVTLGREGERHPLEPVVHELQRHYGDIQVDVSQAEGRQFVQALLATESNRLSEAFREALYRHTQGHALFTVEMLRGLQERGDLVRDETGQWVEGPNLNWETLPARVEGVIAERVGRLPPKLQEAMKVASVEGEVFTAEVLARVQQDDERKMVRQLSGELDQRHRLVLGQGSRRLESGGRQSHYRFRHILFQRYLYQKLDEAERGYLHEAVGNELERLYGEQTEEIAVALARHFEQAGLPTKAISYLHQAGDRAVRLSANEEALALFSKGLALLRTLPETRERYQQELTLQIAQFAPLYAIKGYASSEVGNAYNQALALCQQIGDTPWLFIVLYGLWGYNLVRLDLRQARDLAQQCLALAENSQDNDLVLEGRRIVGETAYQRGELVLAKQYLEQSLALYDPQQHHAHATLYGQDPGVALLSTGSWTLWHLGYHNQALQWSQAALTLAQEWPHPFSLAFALKFASLLHQFRGEVQTAHARAEAAITLSTEQGFVTWLRRTNVLQGSLRAEQGEVEEGIEQMRSGLTAYRATGEELFTPYFLALLAKAYGQAGQAEAALDVLGDAWAAVEKLGGYIWEAELYRLKGEILLTGLPESGGQRDEGAAEACFLQALAIARQQQAKSLELRTVMSLARLWRSQGLPGKQAEAHQMLAEIYGCFTEGFETADLREAKLLLEELG